MPARVNRFTVAGATFLMAVAFAACGPRTGDVQRQTALASTQFPLLDTLVLQETDNVYLGKPERSFTVDDSGSIYLVDEVWNHTVRYRKDGSIDHVFGQAGDGPGEFRSTTPVAVVYDTFVVLASARTLKVFNRYSGQYLFARGLVQGALTDGYRDGPRLFFSFYANDHGVLSIPVTDLHPVAQPLIDRLAPTAVAFPPEYHAWPGLADIALSTVASWSDTLLAGYAGVDYLVMTDSAGTPIDTLDIPRLLRQGSPDASHQLFAKGKDPGFAESVAALSQLVHLWRLPSGEVLIWYQQNHATTVGNNAKLRGQAYLSVLSADRTKACVDRPMTFPGTEWPVFGLHGDTLYAVDQTPSARDSSRSISVIRRYLVTDRGCDWLPIGHRPAARVIH